MIGFSIEFKKWFIVIRGPKGRIYLATGFSKTMPVFTPTKTYTNDDLISYLLDCNKHVNEEEEEEGKEDNAWD